MPNAMEGAMSIVRLIHVTYATEKADKAANYWKQKIGGLIAQQPGCLSEQLLRCHDVPNEFVSLSEWDSEESIRTYLASPAYHEARNHHRLMGGGDVAVRMYERV